MFLMAALAWERPRSHIKCYGWPWRSFQAWGRKAGSPSCYDGRQDLSPSPVSVINRCLILIVEEAELVGSECGSYT